ncbi:unnamed protein product [Acanthoscelides obtectus]|uniref:MADF domain-containing protein n=1 Tax=Acanthoscelides obtectus TaxID=200917 RepID=A0A9P0K8G1_ACAOB|nr:unnamed protein product [Acanthoscelides obtectus]CAK1634200.1 hypothetical protein AOBTE_LOCUS8658 [Acanthoscelides obtectus]
MGSKTRQCELLIECVRKCQVLYDNSTKEYSDNELKNRIWEMVAKDCGFITGNQAKSCWKNLRDGYRHALKAARSKIEDPTKQHNYKPWKFTEQMSFLIPFMKERAKSYNMTWDNDITFQLSESQVEPDNDTISDVVEQEHFSDSDNEKQMSNHMEISTACEKQPNLRENGQQQTDQSRKRKTVDDSEILEFLKEQARKREEKSEARNHPPPDSLKLFFESMYEATKILPIQQQRFVRNTLFDAVVKAEDIAGIPYPWQ